MNRSERNDLLTSLDSVHKSLPTCEREAFYHVVRTLTCDDQSARNLANRWVDVVHSTADTHK